MHEILVNDRRVLIISIMVLGLGVWLTGRIPTLRKFNVPAAVTGGLICSVAMALVRWLLQVEIVFSADLRNLLLLVFFSTIGLSAKAKLLLNGGKTLVVLLVLAVIFLFVQNACGVFVAGLFGVHPAFGLMGGSVSFAGGHGTAISYGDAFATRFDLKGTMEVGIACATMGLVAGGIVGGPLSERLIRIHRLAGDRGAVSYSPGAEDSGKSVPVTMDGMILAIFLITLCLGIGEIFGFWLKKFGMTVPSFLPALFAGILITNGIDLLRLPVSDSQVNSVSLVSDVSLQIFLSISLMSMQLWTIANSLLPLTVLMLLQTFAITFFAARLIFRIMGKDYDAAVISAGFVGLGLGATPVAIANMNALTKKYGASPKAFLVVPLVGAFFIDIVNNGIVIPVFLGLPFFK